MIKIDRVFLTKAYFYICNRIRYINVSNKNILDILSKEHFYKKYKRKYNKHLKKETFSFDLDAGLNKVWIFWYQGLDGAPNLVKSNINSIKRILKDKEVIILTEKNLNKYISKHLI